MQWQAQAAMFCGGLLQWTAASTAAAAGAEPPVRLGGCRLQVRRPVFQRVFGDLSQDLRPGHKPDISLEKYKAVIKFLNY
jgi:hypothetical protein